MIWIQVNKYEAKHKKVYNKENNKSFKETNLLNVKRNNGETPKHGWGMDIMNLVKNQSILE